MPRILPLGRTGPPPAAPRAWLACALGVLAIARGAACAGSTASTGPVTDNDLRIQGVFNTVLPGTEKKHSLRLVLHPHVGDLINEDYLRIPLGLRYGFSNRLQLNGALETYFSHGLGAVRFFEDSGLSEIRLGAKYFLGEGVIPGWDLSVGLDWGKPVGSPPADLTDGMEHTAPFVSFSRWLDAERRWRFFGSATYDDVTDLGIPRHLEKNEFSDDSVEFTAGLLRQRGDVTYTLEAGYATTRLTGETSDDVFMIRPGMVWVLPERYTFWAKGKWLLGSSVRVGYGPDGMEYGVGVKLRISLDFKRLVGRHDRSRTEP